MAVARWALPSTILAMSLDKEAWTSAVRRGASPVAQQHYSSKLPRQPGWWGHIASTFVALSHELTMMGKQAIKSRREDRGDDSDDEDDTGFQEI